MQRGALLLVCQPLHRPHSGKHQPPRLDLTLSHGDIVFIFPIEGLYSHVGHDGVLVVDGTLHGYMQDA